MTFVKACQRPLSQEPSQHSDTYYNQFGLSIVPLIVLYNFVSFSGPNHYMGGSWVTIVEPNIFFVAKYQSELYANILLVNGMNIL